MNELETQLSKLFNAAAGEPPHHVTAHAARRQAIKRRIAVCVSATAALAVAGCIGLVVSANAIVPHRGTGSHAKVTRPKFYFVEDGASFLNKRATPELVVRSVATGAITGRVHCPGPHAQTGGVAVTGRTFFIDCRIATKQDVATGTRIYRFQVSASGRVSGFALIPGGNIAGLRGDAMTVTPDGKWLAVDAAKVVKGGVIEVLVINTKTGATKTWRNSVQPNGLIFHPGSLSFADGDRELAVFGYNTCNAGSDCRNGVRVLRVLSPAAGGGLLSSGRQVFSMTQIGGQGEAFDGYLTQDGKTVIVDADGPRLNAGSRVLEFSARGGKAIRTLLRTGSNTELVGLRGDSSGRFVLVVGIGTRHSIFGWVKGGKLRALTAKAGDVNVFGW